MLLLLTGVVPSLAQAEGLTGKWKHTKKVMKFKIFEWASECGPKPSTIKASPNRTTQVTESGGKIAFKQGRRWKFGTHGCLSQNPEIKFKGYDAGSRTTTCATPAKVAQGEKGKYTLSLVDENTLKYTGKTDYNWTLKGKACRAALSETQTFVRVAPVKPDPPPEPVAAAPPPPPPPPPPVQPEPVPEAAPVADAEPGKGARRSRRRRKKKGGGWFLDLGGEDGAAGGTEGLGGSTDERHQVGTAVTRRGQTLAIAIAIGTVAVGFFAGLFLLLGRRRRSPGSPSPPGEDAGSSGDS